MKQTINTLRNLWQRSALLALSLFILAPLLCQAQAPTVSQPLPRRDRLKNAATEDVDLSSYFNLATGYSANSTNTSVVTVSVVPVNLLRLDYKNTTGTSTVTVTATNTVGSTNASFVVQLWDPVTGNITNRTVNEDSAPSTVNLDAAFSNATSYSVTGNTATNIVTTSISGSTLTLTLITNAFGSASITVRATNPAHTNSDSFTLTVNPVPDAPEILGVNSTLSNINDTNATYKPFLGASIINHDGASDLIHVLVSIDDSSKGTFAGPGVWANGFVQYGTTNFIWAISNVTAQVASTNLTNLIFRPTPNRLPVGASDTTQFEIIAMKASPAGYSSTNSQARASVLSVNDAPSITGANRPPTTVFTGQTEYLFSTVTISDPDVVAGGGGQPLILEITQTGDTNGILTYSPSSGFVRSGNVITLTNKTASEMTVEIRNVAFQAQGGTVTEPVTNHFQIRVTDPFNLFALATNNVVQTASPYVSPDITGTLTGQTVNDNRALLLFEQVVIQGTANGVQLRALDEGGAALGETFGTFENLGSGGFVKSGSGASAVWTFSNTTMDVATTRIRELAFRPKENYVTNSEARVVFEIQLLSGANPINGARDTRSMVKIIPVNDLPFILGAAPSRPITDQETVQPFLTQTNGTKLVRIIDVDQRSNQVVSVTVQLSIPAAGTFLNASNFISGPTGFVITNVTPDAASSNLQNMVFKPIENRLSPGSSETVRLRLIIDDHQGQGTTINDTTTILVTSANDAPIISMTTNRISAPIDSSTAVFADVGIQDPDFGSQTLRVTVSLNDPSKGSLSNLGGYTNSPQNTFVGTDTAATTDLKAILFTPSFGGILAGTEKTVTFTITARDSQNATTTSNLVVTLVGSNRTHIVTSTANDGPGSLRSTIVGAANGDQIVFGITNLPAVIKVDSEIVIDKSVIISGPGADLLTITGEDPEGFPQTRIFRIDSGAYALIQDVTLTKGYDGFAGGAVGVQNAHLTIRNCTISHSVAGQWGGAIDIDGGSLELVNSLIYSNSTTSALGQGGGGVSFYTDYPCFVENTTFAANRQNSPGGVGGGALYAENYFLGDELTIFVTSCTFKDNYDASSIATALRANGFDSVIDVQNTIVADGRGHNLGVDGGAAIISNGGNISDDGTITTFSQGGGATNVILFKHATDLRNTNPRLLPLSNNGGGTLTFALNTNSPAIGKAVSNSLAIDQRGYYRDASADSGAFERGVFKHLVLNEIMFNPSSGTSGQWIEFYNPRDSESNNLAGFTLFVDGVLRHTFGSDANTSLLPGEGLVVRASSSVALTAGVKREEASSGGLSLGLIGGHVLVKNVAGREVLSMIYNGTVSGISVTNEPNESLNLYPEFKGSSYIPYKMMPGSSGLSSVGNDVEGKPLTKGNAPPEAVNDFAETDEDTAISIFVLANDVELDRVDTLIVSNVTQSALGAAVSNRVTHVDYNPTVSAILRSLPVGAVTNDTFVYNIIDCCDPATGGNWPGIGTKYFATNTITVRGVNDAPIAVNDVGMATAADVIYTINVQTNLLANDFDYDTDDNSDTLLIAAIHGGSNYVQTVQATSALGAALTLEIRADRNETRIFYDGRNSTNLIALPLGQTAVDTFFYTIVDRHGARGTAKASVTVTGVNNAPVAVADTLVANEDAVLNTPAAFLASNDIDPDTGSVLVVSSVTSGSALGATVQLAGGTVIYNPTNSAALNALSRKETIIDTFNYVVTDNHGASSTGLVSVVVHGRNDHPFALPDFYATDEDTPISISAAQGVLVNDYDPDVNGFVPDDTIRVVPFIDRQTPAGAYVTMSTNGAFTFDPRDKFKWLSPGQTVQETFQYLLIDNSLTIANDDNFSVQADSVSVTLPVLANDVLLAESGGVMSIKSVGNPDKGGIIQVALDRQSLIYTPQASFSGTESFTYQITDAQGGTDTATVRIRVVVDTLNGTLAANADRFIVAVGNTVELDALANDNILPASSSALTILNVSSPDSGGSAAPTAGSNNRIAYTPNPAPAATYPYFETFTYTVGGGGTVSATGVVTATVINRSNTIPVNSDTFIIGANTVKILNVLANDTTLPTVVTNLSIVSIQTNGLLGNLQISGDGKTLVYSAFATNSNYTEPLAFYTVSNGAGGTGVGSISLSVKSSGLLVGDDEFSVIKDRSAVRLNVLPNDVVLPGNSQPFITLVGIETNAPNQGGTVTVTEDGTALIYTPVAGFVGLERFTYEISDGTLARSRGVVQVKVIDVSALPTSSDFYSVARNSSNNRLAVLKNDYSLPTLPGTLSLVGLQTNGLLGNVSITGSGTNMALLYSPAAEFIGTETFSYIASDTLNNRGTNSVTVSVGFLTIQADNFSVMQDSTNVLSILANDARLPDTNGVRKIVGLSAPDKGGLVRTNAEATSAIYIPAPGFVGTEQFSYQMADDSGAIYSGTVSVEVVAIRSDRQSGNVTVTITGLNHNPVVRDDAFDADEDNLFVIPHATLLANDTDPDSDLELVSVTQSVLGATVQIVGTNVTYNPLTSPAIQALARNEIIVDTFTYTAADDQNVTGTATVTMTITGLNDAPQPGLLNFSTKENVVLNVPAPGVFSNAVEIDINGIAPDDTLRVIPFTTNYTAAGAIVSLSTNGSFTYDPRDAFTGLALGQTNFDSFTYTLVDSSQTVANKDAFTVGQGSSANILPVLANDVALQNTGGNLSIVSVTTPNNGGSVSINAGSKSVSYSPNSSFVGTETFTYTITDGQGGTDRTTVAVAVVASLASPSLNNDLFTVLSDTANSELDVLLNDVILPGTTGVKPIVSVGVGNRGGNIAVNNAGTRLFYTPVPGFVGTETFDYRVDSNTGAQHFGTVIVAVVRAGSDRAVGLVTIQITGENDAPTPMDDTVATDEDTLLDINVQLALLANDTDPDPDDNANTFLINGVHASSNVVQQLETTSALGASVVLEIRFNRNESRILYNPATSTILNALSQGETITDSFWYSIVDSHGAFGAAKINVVVTGVNDAPIANADTVETDEDSPRTILAAELLANDTDVDTDDNGTTLSTLVITNVPAISALGAEVTINDGNVFYNPTSSAILNALARKETALDSFDYEISDEVGARSTNTVSVIVHGKNDRPIAVNDFYTNSESAVLTVSIPGVLGNDSDPDVNGITPDDNLRVIPASFTTTAGAIVSVNADGSFSYDPNGQFNSLRTGQSTNDSFSYTVLDNSLTIANDDEFSVVSGTANHVLPVLLNDVLLAQTGGILKLVSVGTPNNGGSIVTNGNEVTYSPAVSFVGTEIFTYTITDSQGAFDTATVRVRVTSANGPIKAADDNFAVAAGTTVSLHVLRNDGILPVNIASLKITSLSATTQGGSVALSSNSAGNHFIYTPNAGINSFPYQESFQYFIVGPGGEVASAVVNILVVNRNNTLPVNNDSWVVGAGRITALPVLANDPILTNANRTTIVAIQTNGVSGTVTIDTDNNQLIYTPSVATNNYTETPFQYTVTDNLGGSGTATVNISVRSSGLIASDDRFTVLKNSRNVVMPVLLNDAILPWTGQEPTITLIGLSTNAPNQQGAVSVSPDGKALIYTPATNFTGVEMFTYEISDGTLTRGQAFVRIQMVENSIVPTAADEFRVGRNSSNNTLDVLKNDTVLPSTNLLALIAVQTNGLLGVVSINGGTNNSLNYTPPSNFVGRESFSYVCANSNGDRGTNTVTVWISGLVTHGDSFAVLSDSTNTLSVLANDRLFGGMISSGNIAGIGTGNQGGSIISNALGNALIYSPAPGFTGTETFQYWVADNSGLTYTQTVNVAVLAPDSDRSTAIVTVTTTRTSSSAYQEWQRRQFGDAIVGSPALEASFWGDSADPDGDGQSNLDEYITGSDPMDDQSTGTLPITVVKHSDGEHLEMTFRHRRNDDRLTYSLEVSTDLVTWQANQSLVQGETSTPIDSEFEWVTWKIKTDIPGNVSLRLKVY